MRDQVTTARNQKKHPWGWINIPSCLQTACYLRGDVFFLELQKGNTKAISTLNKAKDIIKESYKFSYDLFNPMVDSRLIHSPQCYLPLASKNILDILLSFEQEISQYLRDELNIPYRIHICSEPTKAVQTFLSKLGPIGEIELSNASNLSGNHSPIVNSQNTIDLLENNFFNMSTSKIEERAQMIKSKNMDVALYEMDMPINKNSITQFINILSQE